MGRTSEQRVTMPSTHTSFESIAAASDRGVTWCAPNAPSKPTWILAAFSVATDVRACAASASFAK